jgi:competence protein ComEC
MWKFFLLFLLLANISLWFFIAAYPDENVHVIACDVGQGDGILIYQKTTQLVIDGGPGNKMANCLDRHIPFWDRSVELMVNTHPQADHYEGLIEVLDRYNVETFTAISLNASNSSYQLLKELVGREGSKVINPIAGTKFKSNLLELHILHPSPEWLSQNLDGYEIGEKAVLGAHTSSLDPNEFSVIGVLHYKSFDAIFTGDTQENIERLLEEKNLISDVEYLKVPHHGSKNGLTKEFLEALTPEIAVISNSKKNSYGHPHKEILDMLEEARIRILRTDQIGDVEVISNGEKYWIKE